MSASVSSTPVLRATLIWSGVIEGALLVAGAVVGFLIAGGAGLLSAVVGVAIAAVFLGITAGSILVANRWFGDPLYVPIFFGIVLGGWILKLVLFVIALLLLRGAEWISPVVFFVAVVAGVIASLVVDVVVLARLRLPNVSDTTLPTDPDEGERRDPRPDAEN